MGTLEAALLHFFAGLFPGTTELLGQLRLIQQSL
jgi:hypothetical protein